MNQVPIMLFPFMQTRNQLIIEMHKSKGNLLVIAIYW